MTRFSCFTHHVNDSQAESFSTSMQGTHNGSTICRTNLDFEKYVRLRFCHCSEYRNPNQSSSFSLPTTLRLSGSMLLLTTDPDSAYYHTVVMHLFRPFLKVDLTNSKVSPRDICTSCARNGTSLMGTHRRIYGLRRVPVVSTHILLSTSIIHMLTLPNSLSAQDLALSITCLREMSSNYAFCTRCLHIIMTLSQQWNIQLPSGIAQIAYNLPPEVPKSLPDPQGSGFPLTLYPSAPDLSQQHTNSHIQDSPNGFPFAAVKCNPTPFATSAYLFWSPFPNFGAPLQAHRSPMDILAMIDVPINDWNQWSRDGFRRAQLEDPMLGPPTYNHINGPWA